MVIGGHTGRFFLSDLFPVKYAIYYYDEQTVCDCQLIVALPLISDVLDTLQYNDI